MLADTLGLFASIPIVPFDQVFDDTESLISCVSWMKIGCRTGLGSAHEACGPGYGNPGVADPSSSPAGRPGVPTIGQAFLAAGIRLIVPGIADYELDES